MSKPIPPMPLDLDKMFGSMRENLCWADIGFVVELTDRLWREPQHRLHLPLERAGELFASMQDRPWFKSNLNVEPSVFVSGILCRPMFWWHPRDEWLHSPYVLELIGRPTARRPIPAWMKREALDYARSYSPTKGNEVHTCYYCHEHVTEPEFDHALPISRGGFNHPCNIVVSCKSCNRAKGIMTEGEYGVRPLGARPDKGKSDAE